MQSIMILSKARARKGIRGFSPKTNVPLGENIEPSYSEAGGSGVTPDYKTPSRGNQRGINLKSEWCKQITNLKQYRY